MSALSSPTGYLHTPASSVTSVSLTLPQMLIVCGNDHLRNTVITPPVVSQALRELSTHDVQKIKYVIGLVGKSEFLVIAQVLVAFIGWEFNFCFG